MNDVNISHDNIKVDITFSNNQIYCIYSIRSIADGNTNATKCNEFAEKSGRHRWNWANHPTILMKSDKEQAT